MGYVPAVAQAGQQAAAAERFGFDRWWAAATQADVFLSCKNAVTRSCANAVTRSERIAVATGIAVAVARSPK